MKPLWCPLAKGFITTSEIWMCPRHPLLIGLCAPSFCYSPVVFPVVLLGPAWLLTFVLFLDKLLAITWAILTTPKNVFELIRWGECYVA